MYKLTGRRDHAREGKQKGWPTFVKKPFQKVAEFCRGEKESASAAEGDWSVEAHRQLEPPPEPPVRMCIALAVFRGKLPDDAKQLGAGALPALVAESAYWWAGPTESWQIVSDAIGAQLVSGAPESEDALVVVLVDLAPGKGPSARLTSRLRLTPALESGVEEGRAHLMGLHIIEPAADLVSAGFHR